MSCIFPHPSETLRRRLLLVGLWCLSCGVVAGEEVRLSPPKGYPSREALLAAYAFGGVKLVDRQAAVPETVVEQKDVEYGRVGDRPLLLDLYQPKDRKTQVPGLIFIHGGGWKSGSRQDYRIYTGWFASQGYVVATISYRLSGEAPFPAAVEDAKCAVRWMRKHAAEYGIDPEKIAAIGGSAGGHLSMMLGYSAGDKRLEGHGGNAEVSSHVNAVVNLYGPYDLTTPFAQQADVVRKFLGGTSYSEATELWKQASPASYLKQGAPPTLIFHGTIDETVPVSQSDTLAARLKELKVRYQYERLEGWPHTMDATVAVNHYCRQQMLGFLREVFGQDK